MKKLPHKAFLKTIERIAKETDMAPDHPAVAYLLLSYQRKEVSVLAKARSRCALSLIKALSPSNRILVFCERIEQAEDLYRLLERRFPGQCGLYHSKLRKTARERTLEEFRFHETRILVSCRCLDEGIDVPDANIGIVISSSSVSRQRIQRMGRILRRSEAKDAACLYYLYIQESSDDSTYLQGLDAGNTFQLRYFSEEDGFSHELYEYAATQLLKDAAKNGYTEAALREMRTCVLEGLVRSDYLLPAEIQERNRKNALSIHERNYWNVMRRLGRDMSV